MSKHRSQSSRDVSSWFHRKAQLQTLLGNCGDDEEEGLALDRILHGQSLVVKAEKSVEIENLRFSDKDVTSFGPLAEAQFGTVELVNCRLDGRVYVRKRVSKKFALRNREQCSPQYERHILLQTLKSQSRSSSSWTPHMLCAYQCSSFLNIVMEYASCGSLWDILESSEDGRLPASDLSWWAPQCVSAIDWLHTRAGFVHRDIKPHNFVVRQGASPRLLLIDFGSSAPLLKPQANGVQLVPRSHCLVPCGTCDYISPEILQAHEEALVALEISEDRRHGDDTHDEREAASQGKSGKKILQGEAGYGRETDWWSLGAMLYELAFGIAPFFANDIRQTYARIMSHESNLVFDRKESVPPALISLIKGLLTHHENRIGRRSADELRNHGYFKDVDWTNLLNRPPPPNLLLPEFTYSTPLSAPELEDDKSESSTDTSGPFAFSALFQSSTTTKPNSSFHEDEQDPTSTPAFGRRSLSRSGSAKSAQRSVTSFIGFSWGPPKDAFDEATRIVPADPASAEPGLCVPPPSVDNVTTTQNPPITPKRPSRSSVPPSTVRMTSVRRSAQSRPVSDREAMRVLVNCVGQSARKRVLESGKKPKVLLPQFGFGAGRISSAALRDSLNNGRSRASSLSRSSPKISLSAASGGVRKELRFDDTAPQIMPNLSYTNTFTTTLSNSATSGGPVPFIPPPYSASESGTMSELDGPPSPSPSPRPGSAMSMMSMTRRSVTPTVSSTFLASIGAPSRSSSVPPNLGTRMRSGSLGSLSGGIGRNSNANRQGNAGDNMKDTRATYKARFATSPESSPESENVRAPVPSTPYPRARLDGAKTQKGKAPRRARFADSSDSSDEHDIRGKRERLPTTPHPRAKKALAKEERDQEAHPQTRTQAAISTSAPARAVQFLNSPPVSPPRIGKEKLPMPVMASTPHPKSKSKSKEGDAHEKSRRSAKPPLETRSRPIPPPSRATSTPARPAPRRANAMVDVDDVFSVEYVDTKEGEGEDDVTIRPEPPHTRRLVLDDKDMQEDTYKEETRDADTESLPDYDSIHHHPDIQRCRNPSPPSFLDHDRSEFDPGRPHASGHGLDSLDEMELRFKQLLADIANISLHIDEFASRVQESHPR